jgi:hypothetical protein
MPAAIPAIIALAGTAASVAQQHSAQNAAGRANAQQEQLTREQMAERQQQYAQQEQIYGPVRDKLIRENMAETPPEYAKYADAVRRNYADVYRNPAYTGGNSGLAAAAIQGGQMHQASDLANTLNQAKAEQRRNLMALLGHDQSVNLGREYAGGISNAANLAGNQAAILGQTAGQNQRSAIAGIGALGSIIGRGLATRPVNDQIQTTAITDTPSINFNGPEIRRLPDSYYEGDLTPPSSASNYNPSNFKSAYDWNLEY